MIMAIEIMMILMCGLFDRVRGGFPDNIPMLQPLRAFVYYVAFGATLSMLLTGDPIFSTLTGPFWWLGSKVGYRQPWFAAIFGPSDRPQKYHWWQVGPLKRSSGLALLFRGMMWGIPAALTGFVPGHEAMFLAPAVMGVGMFAGAYTARALFPWLPGTEILQLRNAWPWGELFRGLFAGTTAAIIGASM